MLRRSLVASNTIPAMNVLNNGLWVFSADYRFICSGVLTSLLLEGDVRTVSTNRNQYPEVQVWRIDAGITPTWVARQEIRLTAGDFSPDGVLQYNLTSSIPFQNGDFLGVYSYQPPAFSSVSANQNFDTSTAATIPEWHLLFLLNTCGGVATVQEGC